MHIKERISDLEREVGELKNTIHRLAEVLFDCNGLEHKETCVYITTIKQIRSRLISRDEENGYDFCECKQKKIHSPKCSELREDRYRWHHEKIDCDCGLMKIREILRIDEYDW